MGNQVRQNTKQEEFQSLQSAIHIFLDNVDGVTKTNESAETFRQGLNRFDDLPANEQGSFHSMMQSMLHGFNGVLVLYKVGTLPEYELEAMRRIVVEFLLSPGGRQWWNAFKHIPPTHLVAYLDEETEKAESEILPAVETYPWLRQDN